MEYIDIIDKKTGQRTGTRKAKSEIHKNGDWHRTVHIWIINSREEVLLQRRSEKMENYPNYWDISVAGHISSGENSTTAALREIKEEIGLDLSVTKLKMIGEVSYQLVLNNGTYLDNERSDIYLVKIDLDIDKLKLQKDEIKGLRWITIPKLKNWVIDKKSNLAPHPKEYSLLFKLLDTKENKK